jgi:hypothetical protein
MQWCCRRAVHLCRTSSDCLEACILAAVLNRPSSKIGPARPMTWALADVYPNLGRPCKPFPFRLQRVGDFGSLGTLAPGVLKRELFGQARMTNNWSKAKEKLQLQTESLPVHRSKPRLDHVRNAPKTVSRPFVWATLETEFPISPSPHIPGWDLLASPVKMTWLVTRLVLSPPLNKCPITLRITPLKISLKFLLKAIPDHFLTL